MNGNIYFGGVICTRPKAIGTYLLSVSQYFCCKIFKSIKKCPFLLIGNVINIDPIKNKKYLLYTVKSYVEPLIITKFLFWFMLKETFEQDLICGKFS